MRHRGWLHMYVVAARQISAGEELLLQYPDVRAAPHSPLAALPVPVSPCCRLLAAVWRKRDILLTLLKYLIYPTTNAG